MPAQVFTEGHDPLDTPGVNPGGRMPLVTQEMIEQNHQQFVQQQREQQMLALMLTMTLIFLLICFGAWLYRYRRQVAKAADSAVISGLARAVLFNRKIQAGRKSLVDRVNAKANEGNPPDQ